MELKIEHKARLGEAVEGCLEDAWECWKRQHAEHMSHELAWSQEVLQVHTELNQLHAGRLRIRVTVQAKRPWKSETYYYAWQSTPGNELILQAKV